MGAGPEYVTWNGMRWGVDWDKGPVCDAIFSAGELLDIVQQPR